MFKRFLSIFLICFSLLSLLATPTGAITIDVGGGGSVSPGGVLSRDNYHPNANNAIKVSKISSNGKTLHKQWIIRSSSTQTPSNYYYFKNSHKVWHKQNSGKSNVPSIQQGTSGFNIITDSGVPLTHTIVNGSITASSNFASSAKTYFAEIVKGNKLESKSVFVKEKV
ncbi:MAG: hypothetical protein FWH04_08440 [Oscillospiraceae bacterium]|nr:hypothetical protein [Oscillospiraceae bacterium]